MLSPRRAYLALLVIGVLLLPAFQTAVLSTLSPGPVAASQARVPPAVRSPSIRLSAGSPETRLPSPSQAVASPEPYTSGSSTPQPAASTGAASPEVLAGWDGLNLSLDLSTVYGLWPPDVIVSASPTYVVEMVNLLMGVYTKSGARVWVTGLPSFFNSGTDFISDPKVQYDPAIGRWFASVTDVTTDSVLLAASSTSDPTRSWYRFTIAGSGCLDQPILGVGTTSVIVSVNVFSSCTSKSPTYVGAQYWVINKADLAAGTNPPHVYASTPDVSEFSIHPAQIEGTSSAHYMVSTYWPGTLTTSNTLHLFTVTGTPPSAVTVTVTPFPMSTAAVPPSAPQLGAKSTLDTGDIRVSDAVWSADALWLAFTEACLADAARSCARISEIDTTTGVLVQSFDVSLAGKFVFYPALRVDGTGSVALVFGYSSSTDYPGIAVSGRVFGDALATVQAPRLVVPGTAPEDPSICSGVCRYGDYFGAALDPSNSSIVWLVGEMGTPAGWSTHVLAVSVKAELSLSYRLAYAGTGYMAPIVSYIHGGVSAQSSLSTTPTTILADPGTAWSVGSELGGSSVPRGEIWIVNGSVGAPPTSGIANASIAQTFDFFHQYAMSFGFRVVGGGGYGIAPQLTGTVFGLTAFITTPESLFLDAATPYAYPSDLSGSTSTERWHALSAAAGNVTAAMDLNVTYYHQVVVRFLYTVLGESAPAPPEVHYAYLGSAAATALNATVWADAQAGYAYDAALAGATAGVRWGAGANGTGTVTAPGTVLAVYRQQFHLGVVSDPASLASAVAGAGWYNAGAPATLTATPPTGWQFGSWSGDASGAASSVTVSVLRPMNVTATFDAGLTIAAGTGGFVAYAYGPVTGTVAAGSSVTIYVPVGTTVTLTASGAAWTQAFQGWSGAASGNQATTTIQVSGPGTVSGSFALSVLSIAALSLLVILLIAAVVALAIVRRRRRARHL